MTSNTNPLVAAITATRHPNPDWDAADIELDACVTAWFERHATVEQAAAGVALWHAYRADGGWSWERPHSLLGVLHSMLAKVRNPHAAEGRLVAAA